MQALSSKQQLLFSIQTLQTISDSRQLTLIKMNHLTYLFRQLEQIQASEEPMWAQRAIGPKAHHPSFDND